MSLALILFSAGCAFILVFGTCLLLEGIASKFVSNDKAQFGALSASAGACIARIDQVIGMQIDNWFKAALLVGAAGGLGRYGWLCIARESVNG